MSIESSILEGQDSSHFCHLADYIEHYSHETRSSLPSYPFECCLSPAPAPSPFSLQQHCWSPLVSCGFGASWLLRCQAQQVSLGCSIQKQSPPGNSIPLFFFVFFFSCSGLLQLCVAEIGKLGRNLKSGGRLNFWYCSFICMQQ